MTLAERLRAADIDVVLAAIAELAARSAATPAELEALASCLGHARKEVQRRAAEAFVAGAGAGAADRLSALLRAPAARARWGAAWALGLLGVPPAASLPVLLETFGGEDGDLRWAAATLVCRMAPADVLDALCGLAQDGSGLQRKMALYCLRDIGVAAPGVEDTIVAQFSHADAGVRLAAMSALARLGAVPEVTADRLSRLVGDAAAGVRRAAAATLGRLGITTPAVDAALRAARDGSDATLARVARDARARLNLRD